MRNSKIIIVKVKGSSLQLALKNPPEGEGLFFNVYGKRMVKLYNYEKNNFLSKNAEKAKVWAIKNGLEMKSKPIGKSYVNRWEIFNGIEQDVTYQLIEYTFK